MGVKANKGGSSPSKNRKKSTGRTAARRGTSQPAKKVRGRGTRRRAPSAPKIRNSELSTFRTCRQMWQWNYNEKLQPIEERPALRFGTLVHKALEVRYPVGVRRGPHPAKTFEKEYDKACTEVEKEHGIQMKADDEWESMLELGIDMMEHYVDTYGKDEEWEVLASELTFKWPVYSPPHPDGGFINLRGERISKRVVLFYFVGTMDGVWKDRMQGGVRINDYKTTAKDAVKEALSKAVLDEQTNAYWTFGAEYLIGKRMLKPRELRELDGMVFTMLRKAKRDARPQNAQGHFLNKDGSVSKQQPPPYFHREVVYRSEAERENFKLRAAQVAIEIWQARNGIIPVYKNPQVGSMGHCGWCSFREICELEEMDADWEPMRDATMKTWDPYAAHEIREEGKR